MASRQKHGYFFVFLFPKKWDVVESITILYFVRIVVEDIGFGMKDHHGYTWITEADNSSSSSASASVCSKTIVPSQSCKLS